MPRASKQKPKIGPPSYNTSSGDYSRRKIVISDNGRTALIRITGLEGALKKQSAMLIAVHAALVDHYWYVETCDDKPTAQSRLIRVRETLAAVRSAIAGIKELDYWTRERLSLALNVRVLSLDKLPELRKLESALDWEALTLSHDKTPHRRQQTALRATVSSLAMIFFDHRAATTESWREFVSAALSDAGIKHPDPDEERTRFDKLINPVIAERELKHVP